MKSGELQQLTGFALRLAEAAAAEILPHFRQNVPIDIKAAETWDPVTEGDRAGERALRQMIEKHYPSHGIIGEEYGNKDSNSGLTWILDPVDGTRAFVIGLPTWATLIGLYADGKPLLGVMSQPFIGDTFFGNPEGAWLNHRGTQHTIKVGPTRQLSASMGGTTSPHLYRGDDGKAFDRLRNGMTTMRYGLDCYSYGLLASGHLDIAMDPGLQIYDIAALIPIMTGAGAVISSWSGNDPSNGGNIIAASSQSLLDEALRTMQGATG
ncbi:MAG: inositol monophosphatase family protein [Phyllobacteriaceae bacterium]|nr:inositol monophosphatase family protein [Phyllobacteriaceae bacterium]